MEKVREVKRYSVSLVYINSKDMMLRCAILEASSEAESIGLALEHFKEEAKGFNLSMNATLLILTQQDHE